MKKVITFGEVMLRLATPGFERFGQSPALSATFGGGEANVAVSLAAFGIPAVFVTRLPGNDIAGACLAQLQGLGVDCSHVLRGGERIGIYFLEAGAVQRPSRVIYDRSHSAVSELRPGMIDWEKVFGDATWFHVTGITPALSQGAADTCLEALQIARAKGLTVSVDLNYRKNLWKYGKAATEVMPAIVESCDVVVGNEEDAQMALGIVPAGVDVTEGRVDAEAYRSVAAQIRQRFPRCRTVAFTLRGSVSASHNTWSGVLFDETGMVTAPTYDINPIVDRIGAGDAFAAGIIYGLMNHADKPETALRFAVASSCLKHSIPGDYNRVSVAEVMNLMKGDGSGRVVR